MNGSNANRGGVGGLASTLLTIMARALLLATLLMSTIWWVPEAVSQDEAVTVDEIGDQVQTRRGGALPKFAEGGEVAELYRFAREHPEVMKWMPCTCGCAQVGHTNNRACYIKAETADSTTWTSHAAG
jgi:Protein of unknown function with PCYCGC motif